MRKGSMSRRTKRMEKTRFPRSVVGACALSLFPSGQTNAVLVPAKQQQ
jgi:hypothetical protein